MDRKPFETIHTYDQYLTMPVLRLTQYCFRIINDLESTRAEAARIIGTSRLVSLLTVYIVSTLELLMVIATSGSRGGAPGAPPPS